MSETREEVYNFIVKFQAEHSTSPALYEIAEAVGVVHSTVAYHIEHDKRLTRMARRWIEVAQEEAE